MVFKFRKQIRIGIATEVNTAFALRAGKRLARADGGAKVTEVALAPTLAKPPVPGGG